MTAKTKDNGQAVNRIADIQPQQIGITIPKVMPSICQITIIGISPLVVCAWSHKARREILEKQMFDEAKQGGRPKKKRTPKVPHDDYQASLYVSTEGWTGIPAGGMKGCLVNACRAVDGVPMTVAQRMLFIKEDGKTEEGQGLVRVYGEHRMHEGMVRIDKGNNVDVRFRAMYPSWEIRLNIEFLSNMISPQAIANLIEMAGFCEGLCEWRPGAPHSKTGEWGRFCIKREQ